MSSKRGNKKMMDEKIEQKDRIQILLAEYGGLRSEIHARSSSIYQVATIAALILIWLLQQQIGMRLFLGATAAMLGLLLCAWALTRDLVRAALRIKQIESDINRRAGEELLVWETKWGGQTSTLWSARLLRIILGLNRPPYSN
jgi:hypothetical protein